MISPKSFEDDKFNKRVGAMVRQVRTEAGIDQATLARRLGIAQSAVSEIETGVSGITVWRLRQVAQALDFELRIVFERKNYETT